MPHTFIMLSWGRGMDYQTWQVMKMEWITVLVADRIACITQGLLRDDGSVHDSS
jgi:hypothetical protein